MTEVLAKFVTLYHMTNLAERHVPLMAGLACGCPQNTGVAHLDGFKVISSYRCKMKDNESYTVGVG